MSNGVDLVLARMESHPEEFYSNTNEKWKFIYSEYFRDAMTETEKGLIFDKIKEIRRAEFTGKVMATLTEGMKINTKRNYTNEASFAQAPMKASGHAIGYQAMTYNASTDSYLETEEE
jgi:hypothetical protein